MKTITAQIGFAIFLAAAAISTAARAAQVNVPTVSLPAAQPAQVKAPAVSLPHANVPNVTTPRANAHAAKSNRDAIVNATKTMQESQMSYNLQYLQLQSQMQSENRSYTAVSNIMKTKHDTVKNSIGNIR
jgi:hypothetical protein